MQKIHSLKKQSLYLVGALTALIASYAMSNDDYSVNLDTAQILPPSALADVPSGYTGPADDCGDVGDGGCQ